MNYKMQLYLVFKVSCRKWLCVQGILNIECHREPCCDYVATGKHSIQSV